MFISGLVFRKSFTTKSTVTGTSVFKNLLEKCVVRRFTNFHFCKNSKSFSTTNQRQISFTRFNKSSKTEAKNFDGSRTILNNVLIFKFERSTTYKVVITFAFIQLFGMITMANNIYRTFCKDLFDETKTWRQKLATHPFSLLAIFIGCTCGPVIFLSIIFFASRTVRRIILHKGGNRVTIVTYNVIPSRQIFTESLENMSCNGSRGIRSTLPLVIKGKRFYYFIDTDGDVLNEDLFDFTVGVKRELNDN
ncbi:transmembrane protein 223 [Leptopilina boulardi]|uniref:transmembrane protein 223 n=1 Tax=Leptopilina boulardi TaxID=63433 RepID=UPI0021F5A977|nr:transmembrane protein 223 [Leptopilina boulardi]